MSPLLYLWGLWSIRVFELDPNLHPALWGWAGRSSLAPLANKLMGKRPVQCHPFTRGCLLMSPFLSPSCTICLSSCPRLLLAPTPGVPPAQESSLAARLPHASRQRFGASRSDCGQGGGLEGGLTCCNSVWLFFRAENPMKLPEPSWFVSPLPVERTCVFRACVSVRISGHLN